MTSYANPTIYSRCICAGSQQTRRCIARTGGMARASFSKRTEGDLLTWEKLVFVICDNVISAVILSSSQLEFCRHCLLSEIMVGMSM